MGKIAPMQKVIVVSLCQIVSRDRSTDYIDMNKKNQVDGMRFSYSIPSLITSDVNDLVISVRVQKARWFIIFSKVNDIPVREGVGGSRCCIPRVFQSSSRAERKDEHTYLIFPV